MVGKGSSFLEADGHRCRPRPIVLREYRLGRRVIEVEAEVERRPARVEVRRMQVELRGQRPELLLESGAKGPEGGPARRQLDGVGDSIRMLGVAEESTGLEAVLPPALGGLRAERAPVCRFARRTYASVLGIARPGPRARL
jgi:hypothetical protein